MSQATALMASRAAAAAALGARSRVWRKQAAQAAGDIDMAQDAFSQFLAESKSSGDECSARLLQAGKTLNHLAHRAKTLTAELDAHEKAVESETENLNTTEGAIFAAQRYNEEQKQVCSHEQQEANLRLVKYQAELKELEQISSPEVMAVIASEAEPSTAAETQAPALLVQTSSSSGWTASHSSLEAKKSGQTE